MNALQNISRNVFSLVDDTLAGLSTPPRPRKKPNPFSPVAKDFVILDELGTGAFATVTKVRDKQGEVFALKMLTKTLTKGYKSEAECLLGQQMRHPNVIATYQMFDSHSAVFIKTEFADGGDLFTLLDPSGPGIEEQLARKVMLGLCRGLQYMHSKGLVHCDVKPENVLISNGEAKLCDFGLTNNHGVVKSRPATGTGAYMAPELFRSSFYSSTYTINTAQDVWAMGIILYALFFADLPWEKANIQKDKAYTKFTERGGISHRLYPFNLVSEEMRSIMKGLYEVTPEKRSSMNDVLPFFEDSTIVWFNHDSLDKTNSPTTNAARCSAKKPKRKFAPAMTSPSVSQNTSPSKPRMQAFSPPPLPHNNNNINNYAPFNVLQLVYDTISTMSFL